MKQSELKQFIKGVVREALNERCGGGHLAGGKKGKRMFKHIKQGYKGEKSPEDAKRIAAATVNKELNEDGERSDYEISSTETDPSDYIKCPKCGNPKYICTCGTSKKGVDEDGERSDYEIASTETDPSDYIKCPKCGNPKYICTCGTSKQGVDETSSSIPKGSLAKLNPKIAQKGSKPTMKLGQKPPMLKKVKDAGMTPGHDYDEGEEIKLIKVMQKIAEKLADMHKGEKSEMDEASYKVVAPRSYTNAAEDKALKIQTEPDVNENHKVQTRSYKTVNDQSSNPKNLRDPKVPSC